MADIDKRLKYYNGQFLREQDFTAEQEYHLDRLRRHAGQLHTPGVADGLNVTATVGAVSAVVSPGTALDKEGRQIFLREPYNVAFESSHNGQWVLVVIAYAQEPADEATVGDVGMTRWLERPEVAVVLESGAPPADMRIRLARLRIAANGTIAEHDPGVRTPAGARVRPHETFESLRLSRPGSTDSSQWPVLTSGAANRADLAGNLSVNGNILVTGTVDGRDVSADGALLDTLAASQIEGVSNPGGNIDLVGQNGISIAGNDAANTITFTGGSPISIDGVSNAGGNIDFVGQNGISITPDNTGKLIAFSTSPGAIGALPAGDYLKRATSVLFLTNSDGHGATRTVTCNFEPKFIWATGAMNAVLGGYWYTFTSAGVCRVDSTSSWTEYCNKYYVTRNTGAPYFSMYSYGNAAGLAAASFHDYNQSPAAQNVLALRVTQVTTSGFTVTLERTNWTGREVNMFIDLQIAVFG